MKQQIILFSADSPLASKIEQSAHGLNHKVERIANPQQFGIVTSLLQPGEPVDGGQLGNITRFLTAKQPVLLVFDLDHTEIPAMKWIAVLKSSPATRRLPILVYAADDALLRKAEASGADKAVLRAEMVNESAKFISAYVKSINTGAIDNWCAQPLPDSAHASIELFNCGQFYAAHHALEDLWMNDKGAARDFYRAILQVAVAYYQIERGNYRGAVKMFLRVRQWLEPLPDVCRGINLAQLREDTEAAFARVSELGAARIGEFGVARPIKYQ